MHSRHARATAGGWIRIATRALGMAVLATAPVVAGTGGGACDGVRIEPIDGTPGGYFGHALDMDGSTLVIGGRIRNERDGLDGAADILVRSADGSWRPDVQIAGDEPGFAVAIALQDDVLALGHTTADDACPDDSDCDSGAVHVVVRDRATGSWNVVQRLAPDDGTAGDAFGASVDVDGSVIVVGAPGAAGGGAVYVFDRAVGDTWTQRARLTAPGQVPGAQVGQRVAVAGTVVAAAAWANQAAPPDDVRRVHVFERPDVAAHDWTPVAALTGSTSNTTDAFGTALALAAGTIVVGAPGDDGIALNGGTAHVFRRGPDGGWPLVATLAPPAAPTPQLSFGAAVATDGVTLAVSALPLTTPGLIRTYVVPAVGPPVPLGVLDTAPPQDLVGFTLALDGNFLVAGAIGDDGVAPSAGAAYAFEIDGCVLCPGDLDLDGGVGAVDLAALLAAWGACGGAPCFPDLTGDDGTGFADLSVLLAAWGACADS